MKLRRSTEYIIIHCSATKPNQDIDVNDIRLWHTRDNGWSDIGYHSVITRGGEIQQGRDYHQVGAHCKGINNISVGVCLVGGIDEYGEAKNNFTEKQWKSLKRELQWLKTLFPDAMIAGHNQFSAKQCPSFDVELWLKENNIN